VLYSGLVKTCETFIGRQPLFEQGLWLTPVFFAVAGIAAALCTLALG